MTAATYTDLHGVTTVEWPVAECKHGCGFTGSGTGLSTHERADHHRCHQCGQNPRGNSPVTHMSYCPRATGGRT